MAGEIEIKLKGLREVRQELKVLQFELSQATDPEQMAQLSQKAGELRDNLSRANEQAAVFAAGSPFEQTNNALGLMSSQIMSLDFEGAAESAKLFATAAKGINGQLIATQLKSLGSVVMTLGKAFIKLGISLLTNPIFLIGAAITALVLAFTVFEGKLGKFGIVLKVAFAPLYLAIEAIKLLIQGVKDLLDWLGLTSFAAEEAAERQAAAQEKVAAAYEDKRKKITTAYDQEIVLANIAGENTSDLERKKQQAIIETSRQQYKALEAQRDALRAAGKLTAEQSKQINETMRSLREGIEGARFEIKKLNAQEVADTKKKNEEVEKADKDSYAKRIEAAKKYGEDRLAAQRLIRDLEISIQEDSLVKEIVSINEKYFRIVEDIQKNEKLTSDERKRLIDLYAQEEAKARDEAQKKYAPKEEATTGLLPPPDVLNDEMDALVAITEEGFSNMDRIRAEWNNKSVDGAKSKREALLIIEQSLYDGAAALGQLFINDSKKLERFQKAQALVQIGIDTAKAISALVAASQANPANAVTGGLAGIAQFASGIAQILTNVAKAKQLLTSPNASASGGGGGGGGSSTSAAVPSVAPQVNLFGQGNNMNNLSAAQANEQSITVTAVVSETEITSTQNKIKGIKQMSEL
jgi:hypothetical protein